jgi:hypothetical protein
MANRLGNRVKKIEKARPTKGRWIYPLGYYYGEPNSEPYWTDDPVKPFSAYYDDLEKEKAGECAYRKIDRPNC